MNPHAAPPDRRVHAPPDRPLLVYDGDCGFCRRWIARWQRGTGDRVDYRPFQEVGARLPEIRTHEFEDAVQLIEPDGRVWSGADAVFRLADFAPTMWLARAAARTPGFLALARVAYRFIAARRLFFSRFS